MITGTVKFFNADKGYGFIAPEGGDFMGGVGDMLPDPFEQLRNRTPELNASSTSCSAAATLSSHPRTTTRRSRKASGACCGARK